MKKLITAMLLLVPLTASAGDVCKQLIPDITRNYEVYELEVMRNGNPQVSQSLVSCTYKAVVHEMWGNRPVMLVVLLNNTNNRFTVEVR